MEQIINLRVVNKLVIPRNTNLKTINGISLIATPYDTNIDIGGSSTTSNVLIDGGGFTAPSNSVLIDAGSF